VVTWRGDDGSARGTSSLARQRAGVECQRLAEVRQQKHDDGD